MKRKSITIRPVANGYIISDYIQHVSVSPEEDCSVACNFEELVELLKKRIERENN